MTVLNESLFTSKFNGYTGKFDLILWSVTARGEEWIRSVERFDAFSTSFKETEAKALELLKTRPDKSAHISINAPCGTRILVTDYHFNGLVTYGRGFHNKGHEKGIYCERCRALIDDGFQVVEWKFELD